MWAAGILQTGTDILPLTPEILLIFGIVLVALALFILEPWPIDVTAIGVMVTLIILEPWTRVDAATGIGGFSSTATVTVLAMFVLSEGIRRTGAVHRVGSWVADRFGDNPFKQLLSVLGLSGGTAGFINNTPVVAIMIPMVSQISRKTGISPSKLLMPVSFAAMMGGMLTLIGTSTNLLASDLSGRLIDRPFTMFEFTQLGIVVLLTGIVYLATVGRLLVPERIKLTDELVEGFEMGEYLTEVEVLPGSPLVDRTVEVALKGMDVDADIVQLVRAGEAFVEPLGQKEIREGDTLLVRTTPESMVTFIEEDGVAVPGEAVTDENLQAETPARPEEELHLVEVVISPEAPLVGGTLRSLNFRGRYNASVLAIRRGADVRHARLDEFRLRGGDTLLLHATESVVQRFVDDRDFIVVQQVQRPEFRAGRLPVAVGIIAAVVALAAFEVLDIVVAALAGLVVMILTGCVKSKEAYASVDWSVIFVLAGLIPLGVAMERTGTAAWLASVIAHYGEGLTPLLVLGIFYLFTALLTEVLSNNASVVLLIPVAIDTAHAVGGDPFSFILAVTFAASTAMLTPIGYQTNLMVYGPGGYRFSDFFRVGAPLQAVLVVVTTLGIAFFWGV